MKQSKLYQLFFNINLAAEMKVAFNSLYDEVEALYEGLTDEEKEKFKNILKKTNKEYVYDDIMEGLSTFWAESADNFKVINLEKLE
jgi:hypothetical protein